MTDTGRQLALLLETEEFTLAYGWGLVFVAVSLPLLAECVRHLSSGRPLVACAIGALAVPLAGYSVWNATTSFRRARRRARLRRAIPDE